MSRKGILVLLAVAGVIVTAVAGGPVLATTAKPAGAGLAPADQVFADHVPDTLPAEGIRLGPGADLLVKPTTVDPATLKISSAEAAIAAVTRNGEVPTTNVKAVLASVTAFGLPGIGDRLCWVVSDEWQKSIEIPLATKVSSASKDSVQTLPTARGQVSVLDARTGEDVVGFFLMDPLPVAQ